MKTSSASHQNHFDFICVGGGAAGFFSAIRVAEEMPGAKIAVLEASGQLLSKVRISGGGRCNVTHEGSDARSFAGNYPRGSKELLGLVSKFSSQQMRDWLEEKGVKTKVEADGRVFPESDSSRSIMECFQREARKHRIEVLTRWPVTNIKALESGFLLRSSIEKLRPLSCTRCLVATGSSQKGFDLLSSLGHSITKLSPSLFSFNIKDPILNDLSGLSFQSIACELQVENKSFKSEGPAVVTHWGLSGPAILRISAFAAVDLKAVDYKATLKLNFLPSMNEELLRAEIHHRKKNSDSKMIKNDAFESIPLRFWLRICERTKTDSLRWAELSKQKENDLIQSLKRLPLELNGKTTYKEEFVTAGGVDRKEIDFQSMQSRLRPGLYLGGEVIDVDGVTGGFNFHHCWAGADAIARHLKASLSQTKTA